MSILEQDLQRYDPMEAFTYGLKAPESRRQYPRRFKPFMDFMKMGGSLNEQAKQFWIKARENPRWVEENLMQFIRFQKELILVKLVNAPSQITTEQQNCFVKWMT